METSSAETGSSHITRLGLSAIAFGDANALSLASGKLMRVLVCVYSGASPTSERSSITLSFSFSPKHPMNLYRGGYGLSYGHPRIQRLKRILKHHLHAGATRLRISGPDKRNRSSPQKKTSPLSASHNLRMRRDTVLFPQPDSPTRPKVPPRLTSKLIHQRPLSALSDSRTSQT